MLVIEDKVLGNEDTVRLLKIGLFTLMLSKQ